MLGRLKLVILLLSTMIVFYGLVGGVMDGVAAEGDNAYRELSLFTDVLNKIRSDYVEEPDMQKALTGALHGMMEALDPYASFVDASIYDRLKGRDDARGLTGLTLSKRYSYAYVVAVHPGSSADEEGLRTGDLLESIDGKMTNLTSLWEADRLLKGEPDTSVKVRVIRGRRTEPQELVLERRILKPQEASVRIIGEDLGILKLPNLGEQDAEVVRSRLKMLQSSGIKGLLLDLRGTAGGTLEEATEIASYFLPEGAKFYEIRSRSGEEREERIGRSELTIDVPLVVLVNGGTSGPAEVLAAALKDHRNAQIVGERTDGKGSLLEEILLEDGSVLYIATRLIYRPSGGRIQGDELRESGLKPTLRAPTPDFVTTFYFENTPEELEGPLPDEFYRKLEEAVDREQLEEGIEELKKQVGTSGKSRKAA